MTDKLPPNSPEAESAVLSMMIADAAAVVPIVDQRIGQHVEAWYHPANRLMYVAIVGMHAEAVPVTASSLIQRLKDTGRIDDAGGSMRVVEIAATDAVTSMLDYWLDTLWDKYLARLTIRRAYDIAETISETEGSIGTILTQSLEKFTDLNELRRSVKDTPDRISSPMEFGDKVFSLWFGKDAGEPGIELPFGFPWKIRTHELTLAVGEKGKGKTTMLSWITLHMLRHGMKAFIASMEMHPMLTLKILTSQLLGAKWLEDNETNRKRVRDAIGWLQQRVVIYNFLGAVDYRVLLQAMDHGVEKMGCNFVLIDSLMRLGIADDDYAEQGRCVLSLANHAVEKGTHTVLINHMNKSEGGARSRSRGSAQVPDNAFNVVSIERNEKKWEKVCDALQDKRRGVLNKKEADGKIAALNGEWDAKIYLHNQRYPGSMQNGSKQLWFNRDSQQYSHEPNPEPKDLLKRWTRYPLHDDPETRAERERDEKMEETPPPPSPTQPELGTEGHDYDDEK